VNPNLISLLLLADSRLPAGTHAHSGGLEAAVASGRVTDAVSLHAFTGRQAHHDRTDLRCFAASRLLRRVP
jgi:urease accessory protein